VSLRLTCGVVLATLASEYASGAIAPKKRTFTKEQLQRLSDRNTPHEEYQRLTWKFQRFRPASPEDVDLLYSCFESPYTLESPASEKLCQMRKSELLARSRSYISASDLRKAKVAIRVVRAAKDKDAIPVLRKFAVDPKAKKHALFAKETLAQLGDEELLNQLLDEKRRPEDSTLADQNRALLKTYGKKGLRSLFQRLKSRVLEGKAHVDYIRYEVDDPDSVPDLLELYEKTKDEQMKVAVLRALCRINTAECQPLLRRCLNDKAVMDADTYEMGTAIVWALWKYDAAEIGGFRDRVLVWLTGSSGVRKSEAMKMLAYFRVDQAFESKAARALARPLSSKRRGRLAAQTLEKLTGQKFQYAEPFDDHNEWKARRKAGRETAQDLGYTEENVRAYEARELAMLAKYRKTLDADRRWSREQKDRMWKIRQADVLRRIERRKKLLRETPIPPWKIGIPVGDAEAWIMNHYAPKNEEEQR